MLAQRGVNVDHTTIYRWVQRYAPEMEKRLCSDVEHRQIKYRNNVIEYGHGKLKRIIGAMLGFEFNEGGLRHNQGY